MRFARVVSWHKPERSRVGGFGAFRIAAAVARRDAVARDLDPGCHALRIRIPGRFVARLGGIVVRRFRSLVQLIPNLPKVGRLRKVLKPDYSAGCVFETTRNY